MLNLVRAWIVLSAVLCAAGWVLSLAHKLDRSGYGLLFVLLVGTALFWLRSLSASCALAVRLRSGCHKLRRFRRPLPLSFAILTLVILVGGFTNEMTHADAMQYRTARVLHWLDAGAWHWINTADIRLNIVSCGFEWLSAPLLLFTRTDRWIFLINAISFLMLPGLVFGLFRQLGVPGRVAWAWMWILPAGWCYAMQAGGGGNDAFAVVYALAAVYLALRAGATNRVSDLWLSMLACALVTGTKQTNLPLVALWAIAAWPSRRLFRAHLASSAAAGLLALSVSALPLIWVDWRYTGSWTGWPKGHDYVPESPFWGLVGNLFMLPFQNLMPPFFPFASSWNKALAHFINTPLGAHFSSFEHFGQATRSVSEQNAALGLTIWILLLVSAFAARAFLKRTGTSEPRSQAWWSTERLLAWVPWVLLLVFMMKVGACHPGRYLAAYYPFLLVGVLLRPGHTWVCRASWWNRFAISLTTCTIVLLAVSRQRPVWPVGELVEWLDKRVPSRLTHSVREAYSFPNTYRHALDPLIKVLPADQRTIGFATKWTSFEVQLWLPFGTRRVIRIGPSDSSLQVRHWGIGYAVVDETVLQVRGWSIQDWLAHYGAQIVACTDCVLEPELPPSRCYLVRLQSSQEVTSYE